MNDSKVPVIAWTDVFAAAKIIADECERYEQAATTEEQRMWFRAYAAGARRLLGDIVQEATKPVEKTISKSERANSMDNHFTGASHRG